MRLPRDVSAAALQTALRRLGYEVVRQRGSHLRITTEVGGEHHEVIPNHNPIRVKTLSSILKSIAQHHDMSVEQLLRKLDL
ncbi:MAG: addiction module toxin, HicA family [Gemmatimonadales bacterium]|nr:addiction module toxin, HicA family [Gemmatimonadales bacterium]